MLKLFAAPATNDRGPRFMERAFAAIHQAHQLSEPLALHFAGVDGQVAMAFEFAARDDELIVSPVTAHYPNCSLTTLAAFDEAPGN